MSIKTFPYNSLHEYLDDVLSSISGPSHEVIKNAKQTYWKLYYKHYRKQKRKNRKEFTLGFSKQRLHAIYDKKGTLSVSKFLYLVINKELESNDVFFNDQEQLSKLHLEIMTLISLTEELLDNNDSDSINEMLERLETLENSFENFINP